MVGTLLKSRPCTSAVLTQAERAKDPSPKDKVSLGLNWERGDLSVNLINTRYGEVSAVAFTNLTPAQIAVVTAGYDVRFAPTATPSAS